MINKIAIFSSHSPQSTVDISNFFKEGNRVSVDCFVTDSEIKPEHIDLLQKENIPFFFFPAQTWREEPEKIISLLRERGISVIFIDNLISEVPRTLRELYPRTLITVKHDPDEVHAVRITPDDEEILISESPENIDTLPQRAIVASIQAPLVNRSTPPPFSDPNHIPTPEEEWAQTLHIPDSKTSIPPIPQPIAEPPKTFSSPDINQSQSQEPAPKMPDSYLLWSILSLVFCCFIPSIVAIVFSSQVSSKYYAGDYKGSERASRNAQIWIIISIVLGVVSSTLYLPLTLLGS